MENATIIERIPVTNELMILRVKPDGGVPDFQCGQYVALGLPGKAPRPTSFPAESEVPTDPEKIIKRAYSIGSSPSQKEYLEFYIAVVESGSLTPRILETSVGSRIFAAPKIIGTFTLAPVASENNLVLVSTGTGLAPVMSMLKTESTWTSGRNITLIHGVRFAKDLAYRDEIAALQAAGKPLTYYPVVSRETSADKTFATGYVQDMFKNGTVPLNPQHDHVFLCGNPKMVEDVEVLLVPQGYVVHSKKTPGNLHVEKYW